MVAAVQYQHCLSLPMIAVSVRSHLSPIPDGGGGGVWWWWWQQVGAGIGLMGSGVNSAGVMVG